jgi:hypothetical protein
VIYYPEFLKSNEQNGPNGGGKLRAIPFSFAVEDVIPQGSAICIARLPPGAVRVLFNFCFINVYPMPNLNTYYHLGYGDYLCCDRMDKVIGVSDYWGDKSITKPFGWIDEPVEISFSKNMTPDGEVFKSYDGIDLLLTTDIEIPIGAKYSGVIVFSIE